MNMSACLTERTIFLATPECVRHSTDAPLIAVKVGQKGYWPIYTRATPEALNHQPMSEEIAMLAVAASMADTWDARPMQPLRDWIERKVSA